MPRNKILWEKPPPRSGRSTAFNVKTTKDVGTMTSVIIVADGRKVREEFRDLLRGRGIEVLRTCSVEDASRQVAALQPDAILLELTTSRPPNVIERISGLGVAKGIRILNLDGNPERLFADLGELLRGGRSSKAASLSKYLTPREMQVARLIKKGHTNGEIAHALSVGESTVKSHVHAILQKLRVKHRGQIAARLKALQTQPDRSGNDLDPWV